MADIFNFTDTWNNAGTVFNGIKLNITNTASAAGSNAMTLQIGGTDVCAVTKEGSLEVTHNDAAVTTVVKGAAGATANIFEVQDSASSSLLQVAPSGDVTVGNLVATTVNGATIAPKEQPIKTVGGTTHTLTAADLYYAIHFTNAGAITVTLPQTSTEALPQGFQAALVQKGTGQISVVTEGTDTTESLNNAASTAGQYAVMSVVKEVAGTPNTWGLYGSLG